MKQKSAELIAKDKQRAAEALRKLEAAREQTLQMEQQKENLRKSILLMEKLRKVSLCVVHNQA